MSSMRFAVVAIMIIASIGALEVEFEDYSESGRFLEEKKGGKGKDFKYYNDLANTITSSYQKIVSTFGSSTSTIMKEYFTQEGFEKIKMNSKVRITRSIKEENYDAYFKVIMDYTLKHLPLKLRDHLLSVIEETKFIDDSNSGKEYDVIYSDKSLNNAINSAGIIIIKNKEEGTFDVIISYLKSNFVLAPDIMVLTKSKFILGGIYSSAEDIIKEMPPKLTLEDIKQILCYFQIVGLQATAESLGIQLPPLPE